MGKKIPTTVSMTLGDGREITIETGKLATQADGSVVVRVGDTMLFASVVSAHDIREGQSFFPLSVDYQEKFAAAGRIPGNFFKREARLSDYEILTSRLVDRALRPLFPDGYMNDTQIIINLISADKEELPDAYAALAASAALAVSDIPFAGPLSEVRVAKIDGEFMINPKRSDMERSSMEVIVAATMENVMMVEGEAKECDEAELIEAIKIGHETIKKQITMQNELAKLVGDKALIKRPLPDVSKDPELESLVKETAEANILEVAKTPSAKDVRKANFKAVKEKMLEDILASKGEEFYNEHVSTLKKYFDSLKKETIRNMMLDENTRLDGRKTDEIRPIWTEVGYLPSTHGSSIFNRGETQALATLTLGTKLDEQMIDTALDQHYSDFILHYNFPALSVGEIKPMRGPGRREVGHANLASRSLKQVLPGDDFPYTIRIVSDILESNGSSSMATVCSGSMALMDAGVPIKKAVSGIAMGMISDGKRNLILSDILGDEDALGDMDFKVTGTKDGITGCQMDIKIDGLPYELLEKALEQARVGRIHIIECMEESISVPAEDLKPHAPRMIKIKVDKSFIGAIIGPGGKIIQEIQKETETVINIEEVGNFGEVSISSSNKDSIDAALERINAITFTPTVGDVFDAVVSKVADFGVFVDFKGKTGLLHVSEISHSRIDRVSDVFKEGDPVKVKLIKMDERAGKLSLSRKALLPRPEGMEEETDRRGGDDRRGGGDRRGGDRRSYDRRGGGRDDRRGGGRDDRRGGGRNDDRAPRRNDDRPPRKED